MQAAVIPEPGVVTVESVPDPVPGPRDVVVRVAGCGICGTDLHIMDGEFAPAYPIVPGHEFAGEVVEVGASVTELRVGAQVAVDPTLNCGQCHYCRRGRGNLCDNWAAIGVTVAGGAAEYALAPEKNCVVLPEHVEVTDAALIEPLSCAVRGFDVLPRVLGDHYLIYGAGTMGLMMMELAKRCGAATVSVVDINPDRLSTAELLGCHAVATSAGELDRARGWEVVIDCTGAAEAITDGLARVAKGGTFLQFGVASYDTRLTIEPYRIYNQELTVTGSMAVLHSYERAGELFTAGVLRPDVFVSHRYRLEHYAEAIGQFRAGVGRKSLIVPGKE